MGKFLFALVFGLVVTASTSFAHVNGKQKLVDAVSMGASITSAGVDTSQFDNLSLQAKWTGITASTGSGTFKIQAANSLTSCTDAANTWTDQSGTSQAIAADGDFMWNLVGQGYRCVRLVYTRAAGTGTLNVTMNSKGS